MREILDFIIQTLLAELIVVVAGFLLANYILTYVDKRRFGGWKALVTRQGKTLVERPISPHKAKELLQEPADLVVFLKGVVSSYETINCDLWDEGQKIGLLRIDKTQRTFTVDLDKNPPGKGGSRL
ncbi:MAG: hypothetical protein AB1791_00020 [Chloroflexota bacterium]